MVYSDSMLQMTELRLKMIVVIGELTFEPNSKTHVHSMISEEKCHNFNKKIFHF